jgi:endonuclease/exonuclease/phosphatase (EEP) superfamily protein YafD
LENDVGMPRIDSRARGGRRVIAVLVCGLVVLAYAGLLFGRFMPQHPVRDSDAHDWLCFVAGRLRTFEFHLGIAMAVLAGIALLLRLRRTALLTAPVLIWTIGAAAWSSIPHRRADPASLSLTLMSANLLVHSPDVKKLLGEIDATAPDVIVMQEYTAAKGEQLRPALREQYPHIVEAMRNDAFGQAVYSKRPFLTPPELHPQGVLARGARTEGVVGLADPQIRVTIDLDGRELVVQNVHFVPPMSPQRFAEQRRQVEWLAEWLADETRSLIVLGDFNSTPESAQSALLREAGLRDAHHEGGSGRGTSWPDVGPLRHLPGIRIDQAFVGGELVCDESRLGGSIGSDHRPLLIRVHWR